MSSGKGADEAYSTDPAPRVKARPIDLDSEGSDSRGGRWRQCAIHGLEERLVRKWLLQQGNGPDTLRIRTYPVVDLAGNEYRLEIREKADERLVDGYALRSRQVYVEHRARGLDSVRAAEQFRRRPKGGHVESAGLEQETQRCAHSRVVLHYQDRSRSRGVQFRSVGRQAAVLLKCAPPDPAHGRTITASSQEGYSVLPVYLPWDIRAIP